MATVDPRRAVTRHTGRFVGPGLRQTAKILALATVTLADMARGADRKFDVRIGPYNTRLLVRGSGVWVRGQADDVDSFVAEVEKRARAKRLKAVWTPYQPPGKNQ
jgi:hypothetical protein